MGVEITTMGGADVVAIEASCVAVTMITSGIVEVVVVGGVIVDVDDVVLTARIGSIVVVVVVVVTTAVVVVGAVVGVREALSTTEAGVTVDSLMYFPATDFASVVVGTFAYFPATDFGEAVTVALAFGLAFAQDAPPNSAGTTTIATTAMS